MPELIRKKENSWKLKQNSAHTHTEIYTIITNTIIISQDNEQSIQEGCPISVSIRQWLKKKKKMPIFTTVT